MSQENSALVPNNYDKLPREAKKTADSTYDRIFKYYHNSKTRIELSIEESTIRDRWEKAWFLLCRHRTQKQVVDLLVKLFGIGKSVAYDDVRNAMTLFSNPQSNMKDAKRAIAENALLQGASKAWNSGDVEMHLKYWKEYIELNGLNKDDNAMTEEMIKKFKPHKMVIVATMEELQNIANKLQEDLIQDIDHTEVNEED